MSYNIAIFKPVHPGAVQDKEQEMVLTSFVGPVLGRDIEANRRWLQIAIGTEVIRLNPAQIFGLHTIIGERIRGTDREMLDLNKEDHEEAM